MAAVSINTEHLSRASGSRNLIKCPNGMTVKDNALAIR